MYHILFIKSKLLLAGLFFSILGYSQSYTGEVLDENNQPLVNAYVSLIGLKRPAIATDLDGKFSIDKVSENDSLYITFVGYQDLKIKALDSYMTIQLVRDNTLDESVVKADLKGTQVSLLDPKDSEILTVTELCKAACCNLSEAFETNASIDASFTDAVTGTRQIQMLGLSGTYVQITQDNIPSVRGLASVLGLSRIPGTWINNIYISKGAGSVTNGYESVTGQINVATFSPETAKGSHVNMYFNQGGRGEFNSYSPYKISEKLSGILLTHAEYIDRENDRNNDGFYDVPLKFDIALRNSIVWKSPKGWSGNYTANLFSGKRTAGFINEENTVNPWPANHSSLALDFSAKTGYVFPDAEWHSFGSQINFGYDSHNATFGSKEYEGIHNFFRANLLYWCQQTETWEYTLGVSSVIDNYTESLDSMDFDRTENVQGIFFENTWEPNKTLVIVSGIRADYHNFYGAFFSPRLHARFHLNENRAIKLAAGIGHRSPVTIMDNIGVLASNRNISFPLNSTSSAYGLELETAFNYGISYTHTFKLSYRPASYSLDFYRTEFTNQVVVDRETPSEVKFYNLKGQSFSNSLQAEFNWEPFKRTELRMAYRYLDVKTDYDDGEVGAIEVPLIPPHRLFTNLAYKTKQSKKDQRWLFDLTAFWSSEQRLPLTGIESLDENRKSDSYLLMNGQITRDFSKDFSFYLGIENLLNFRQSNPIISSSELDSELFDASVIWAPIFGRMIYTGFRWDISKEK